MDEGGTNRKPLSLPSDCRTTRPGVSVLCVLVCARACARLRSGVLQSFVQHGRSSAADCGLALSWVLETQRRAQR